MEFLNRRRVLRGVCGRRVRAGPACSRYGRIGAAILVYFVYSNLVSAARTWVEKGSLSPSVGVWWTHLVVLAVALYLLYRQSPPQWATR